MTIYSLKLALNCFLFYFIDHCFPNCCLLWSLLPPSQANSIFSVVSWKAYMICKWRYHCNCQVVCVHWLTNSLTVYRLYWVRTCGQMNAVSLTSGCYSEKEAQLSVRCHVLCRSVNHLQCWPSSLVLTCWRVHPHLCSTANYIINTGRQD